MKALMGNLAKLVRKDKEGKQGLREFITSGKDEMVITLSNGEKFVVSREKRAETAA
ncbi:hypothetical protein [Enterovibrio norvegicus]|uniref:hypothetical protein n=1 Tax=Enterovibrio norvegicus TaxID=188144 RepID=UPI00352DFEB7